MLTSEQVPHLQQISRSSGGISLEEDEEELLLELEEELLLEEDEEELLLELENELLEESGEELLLLEPR